MLNGQLELINGLVYVKFVPVSTFTTLGFALKDPEPLDVGILLVAHASDHSVAVHGIHNVWLLLCSLSPAAGLKEEGILERKQESVSVARKVA